MPRILQQQPQRESDPQQQRAGATDFQPPRTRRQVEGEGSYSATRDYQKDIEDYLDKADVEADAEAAKPRSEAEAASWSGPSAKASRTPRASADQRGSSARRAGGQRGQRQQREQQRQRGRACRRFAAPSRWPPAPGCRPRYSP